MLNAQLHLGLAQAVVEKEPIIVAEQKQKLYTVTEIFGCTMQGEGPVAGQLTVFVRLHFCESRCSWCDTRYTWDHRHPDYNKTERLTAQEIVNQVTELYRGWDLGISKPTVTISGGNPAIQLDQPLIDLFHLYGYSIQLETQGTVWKSCLSFCDKIVVSPKPPSSGMVDLTDEQLSHWTKQGDKVAFKTVVFNDLDFEWAQELYVRLHLDNTMRGKSHAFYLQSGTDVVGDPVDAVVDCYGWLVEKWLESKTMPKAIILPQLHVLVWGRAKGV